MEAESFVKPSIVFTYDWSEIAKLGSAQKRAFK
jgi:hypothetical protein